MLYNILLSKGNNNVIFTNGFDLAAMKKRIEKNSSELNKLAKTYCSKDSMGFSVNLSSIIAPMRDLMFSSSTHTIVQHQTIIIPLGLLQELNHNATGGPFIKLAQELGRLPEGEKLGPAQLNLLMPQNSSW